MEDDYRDEAARLLGKELLRFATAENQPLSVVVPRHAQRALSSLGEISNEFYLGPIGASDLERVRTLDELATLLRERMLRNVEVDDGGWTAF